MNKQLVVWRLIAESLQKKIAVTLLYVLESSGSSPGRQGFFMAVNANDEMEGSIGGGIMEHKFVEMTKERLQSTRYKEQGTSIKKQVHDKMAAKNQSGMICSGEQTILLYHLLEKDQVQIQNIINSLQQNENGMLILSPSGIEFLKEIPVMDFEFNMKSEQDWQYKEKTGYKNQLFIVGGGHCSLALSKLMRSMDFYTHVYDDRKDLKTMTENDTAHEKHFINNYTELVNLIPSGNNHYVVIMTFGYRTDDTALRSLIHKDFKYLGVLGSKNKMGKMFDDYYTEGIEKESLHRIHTPVGISIKSQTPEEIAVSIAAEIIKVKNQHY